MAKRVKITITKLVSYDNNNNFLLHQVIYNFTVQLRGLLKSVGHCPTAFSKMLSEIHYNTLRKSKMKTLGVTCGCCIDTLQTKLCYHGYTKGVKVAPECH